MMVMLGDEVTLQKNETWVTGRVSGVILDNHRQLERIYLHEISFAFYMSDNWRFVNDEEEEDGEI
jgi:hypothetical protein